MTGFRIYSAFKDQKYQLASKPAGPALFIAREEMVASVAGQRGIILGRIPMSTKNIFIRAFSWKKIMSP